eukprot:6176225-Pleurochrysis_carterae.AAC.6
MSRPACDHGLYCVVLCGWRVGLASVQAVQPSKRLWASEAEASAVMVGRARMRLEPASRHRDRVDWDEGEVFSQPRVVTRHSYNPSERLNGRTSRSPCGVGGEMMAFISAKQHPVADDAHSESTERRESLNLGTHHTSLSVTATCCLASFRAVKGRSPMVTQRWGRPSMPATRSQLAVQTFTKSERWG